MLWGGSGNFYNFLCEGGGGGGCLGFGGMKLKGTGGGGGKMGKVWMPFSSPLPGGGGFLVERGNREKEDVYDEPGGGGPGTELGRRERNGEWTKGSDVEDDVLGGGEEAVGRIVSLFCVLLSLFRGGVFFVEKRRTSTMNPSRYGEENGMKREQKKNQWLNLSPPF